MNFMVDIDIKKPESLISYGDSVMLIGSCFTEHIGRALDEAKLKVMQNPNGILFDPDSVCRSLVSYVEKKTYTTNDLFELNEVWHSWEHHSRFSGMDPDTVIQQINESQEKAHDFLKQTNWLIITLGSAFSYRLTIEQTDKPPESRGVANCHRAPAKWFDKHLLDINSIIAMLDATYHRLLEFNPELKIIFTVSPVRHLRDGAVENNRSKARLIESVHHLAGKYDGITYFPAYELVIDVLRDYRFYDIDLAHPNYMATEFVLEKFTENYIGESSRELMKEIRKIAIARRHRPMQPGTTQHRQFLLEHAEKVRKLMEKHPFLNMQEELNYFSST